MSLSLCLIKPECPTCHHQDYTESENYTYNVSSMWYKIFPDAKKMVDIDGITGAESLPKIQFAINTMINSPDEFKALNPENGWGSYAGFIAYLGKLIEMASRHPTWIWEAFR